MKMRNVMQMVLVALFSMALVFPAAALADEKAEAVKFVKDAVAYYKTNGLEKTLDVLNDPKGPFVKGDLYVFAYSYDGIMMANVAKPNLVGQNVLDVPDAKGKKFRREIVERAKKEGFGWTDYTTIHPKTKQNEEKTSYFEAVGDEIILSCGIYKK